MTALIATTAAASSSTSHHIRTTAAKSTSIPIETKNVALNRICRGSTSPSACELWRDSLTTSPARNAPRATLTPASEVNQAVPSPIATTVSRNTSGEQVRATRSSNGGITFRAITSTTASTPSAVPRARTMPNKPPPESPPSSGTSSTMTTTARSWKISVATEVCPTVRVVRPVAESTLSTIAVDDSDTSNPVNTAAGQPTPNARTSAVVSPADSSTCRPPPTST